MIYLVGIGLALVAILCFYYTKSRSVPSPRPMLNVYDDPRARDDDDLDDCTNPFRTDNNVRVRDLVIKYGELDDTGRKGMALIQVAEKFEKDYRQPLGGIPGLTEEKLMTKMSVVKTVEWIVERMGDNHAYVIVPEETLKKAHEVGPGTSTAPRPGPAEKPKSSGVSPAAKRMFGFALKGALSVNQRQNGTRERNLQEREMIYGEIVAGFDGDPVMTEMEAPPPSPPKKTTPRRHHFDRAVMMSLSDHDSLDAKVESLAGSMRILRTQTSPASSSSHSSHSGRRPFGRPLARITPPVSSSNMFSSGFGGAKAVPSFGTFKSGPPPASIAAADKDDDDDCVVLEPSQSSLASKLPQMSFKDSQDSGYSEEPPDVAEKKQQRLPMEIDLRRQLRKQLGLPGPSKEQVDDVTVDEEEDVVIIEKEVYDYSPPLYPPGLVQVSVPPGIVVPRTVCGPLPPPAFLPHGVWVASPMPFMPPPGLPHPHMVMMMTGPPPGLWVTPQMMYPHGLSHPPTPPPPSLPPPNKDHPVEYKGEVYYDTPAVWPPPVKKERSERREKKCLPIQVPSSTVSSSTTTPSAFPSEFSSRKPVPVFARKPIGVMTANGAIPSFGTSSQSVPYNPAPTPPPRTIPTFGTTSASSPFQSAFGGAPKKMVEVIGSSDEKKEEEAKAEEVLGATIQFIGRLRGGEIVYMKEIDNTPIEDIIANNPDFFDIDENDDHIHLLHRDVDPKLLMYDGQQLGEMVAEKKTTPAPEPSRAGAFSRPSPPTFGRPSPSTAAAAPPAIDPKPTFGSMSVPSFAKTREIPTFGTVNRLAVPTFGNVEKREEKKEEMPSEPLRTESRPIPTFGAPSRAVEKPVERAAPTPSFSAPSPKPLEGMPSFGTKSRELERPDSALSNGSHDPKKVPTFDTVPTRAVERAESVVSDKTEDGTQQSKYSSASSTISSSAEDEDPMRKRLSSVDSESFHSSEETMEKKEEMEDPYTFHSHPNLRSLCKKSSIALDSVRPGETIRAAIITSFNPNLIVLAMVEANMHDNLKTIMHDLRRSYVDVEPIGDGVRLGQFAVAINGECIVRVVVLRKTETIEGKKAYECACLDFNALITVEGSYLHPLFEKFNVTAIRATTFVARINKVADLTARGHRAVKLVAKSEDEDDDIKKPLPVVFHGKDEATGELVVDVAMTFGKEYVWMGETLPRLIGNSTMVACSDMINPNIEHAIEFAVKRNMDGYQMEKKKREEKVEKKSVEEAYERADTPNEADLTPTLRCESEEKVGVHKGETIVFSQKEEGELDTSLDDSFTSERTTVDRHAAGDFVREVKSEIPDEFVIVAPVAPKAIINVESMTSLIRQLNANGESLEVEVIKSMCKALVLTANKMLSNQGERGALIANAEALEEIDML